MTAGGSLNQAADSGPELSRPGVQLDSVQIDLDHEAVQDVTDSWANDEATELPDLDWLDASNLEVLPAFVGGFGAPRSRPSGETLCRLHSHCI